MNDCEMCRNIQNPIEKWDEPIYESDNFVSFPSVGALVPGYMLVLPKYCKLSMADIPLSHLPELITFTYHVADQTRRVFGPDVVIYEHGPKACSTVDDSCTACIDHAHFHIVPIPSFAIYDQVSNVLPENTGIVSGLGMTHLSKFKLHNYLYLEYPLGVSYTMMNETFRSQLIRSVIAEYIGIPEEYNWRKHPQFANLDETIERFKQWLMSTM